MRTLTPIELSDVFGGFKLHFNLIGVVASIAGAAVMGNPLGVVAAIGIAIITQGGGNLVDMYVAEGFTPQYSFGQAYNGPVYYW